MKEKRGGGGLSFDKLLQTAAAGLYSHSADVWTDKSLELCVWILWTVLARDLQRKRCKLVTRMQVRHLTLSTMVLFEVSAKYHGNHVCIIKHHALPL